MQVAIETLGCKVNQFESAALEEKLRAEGHTIVPASYKADVYIINTCTVTGRADFQSRQLIRRALRTNPFARIIVTGCYVQTGAREILDKYHSGNICLVGNDQKAKIPDYLTAMEGTSLELYIGSIREIKDISPFAVDKYSRHTRAFLRVQDGCNAFCSYCIVPYARGRARSLPISEAVKQARQLVANDHQEIVLTGINLGRYGTDLAPRASLFELLVQLERCGPSRIRISSIEPTELTDEIIDLVAESRIICPHFHIPLQSGSREILKRMNRHYTPVEYRTLVNRIHAAIPQAAIGLDVMVGFPGEREEEFKETYDLISELPVSYLHVFRYSPREGTVACAFPQRVGSQTASARAKHLQELGLVKKKSFYFSNIGVETTLLLEGRYKKSKLYKGLTSNYVPVLVDLKDRNPEGLVDVRIERIVGDQVVGTVVQANSADQGSVAV